MTARIPVTIVNHAAIDIAATAEALWNVIIEDFIEAKGFRTLGTVTSLDDPAAPLGGSHMRLLDEDGMLDERIVHITERDEGAQRLSVCADFLSVPGGMRVYATYHAQETANGARFTVDCHTDVEIEIPAGAARADVAVIIARQTAAYDESLTAFLRRVRERLQGAGVKAPP